MLKQMLFLITIIVISGCGESEVEVELGTPDEQTGDTSTPDSQPVETSTPNQQRAERDLVIEGRIKHVKKGRRYENKDAETWGGAMEVIAKVSGESRYESGDVFPFLFERGKPIEGGQGREPRTPPFPTLKGGDTGTFYLKLMSPEDKERMGLGASDAKLYMVETADDFVPAETSTQ